MELLFYKYHGLGNDYLVYDCQKNSKKLSADDIQKICHRNYGLGADGILAGPIFQNDIIGVRIFNPDGSEAEKSGNGVRIFSNYLKDAGYVLSDCYRLRTLGGMVEVRFNNALGTNMTVSMGTLSFERDRIGAVNVPDEVVDVPLVFNGETYQCTCVSIGNPHCVIPLGKISKEQVCTIGSYSECAPYFPQKINTQLVHVKDRKNIEIEIYERGAGYTLASGSSSCAAAGAVFRLGLTDSAVNVHMPGGSLKIEIDKAWNVTMTGDTVYVGKMEYHYG